MFCFIERDEPNEQVIWFLSGVSQFESKYRRQTIVLNLCKTEWADINFSMK